MPAMRSSDCASHERATIAASLRSSPALDLCTKTPEFVRPAPPGAWSAELCRVAVPSENVFPRLAPECLRCVAHSLCAMRTADTFRGTYCFSWRGNRGHSATHLAASSPLLARFAVLKREEQQLSEEATAGPAASRPTRRMPPAPRRPGLARSGPASPAPRSTGAATAPSGSGAAARRCEAADRDGDDRIVQQPGPHHNRWCLHPARRTAATPASLLGTLADDRLRSGPIRSGHGLDLLERLPQGYGTAAGGRIRRRPRRRRR